MKTIFEQIYHWKAIGEWSAIESVFNAATTLERYYEITYFVNTHKAQYGYRYREKILANSDFIAKFGYLDLEYLKKAQKTMAKKF